MEAALSHASSVPFVEDLIPVVARLVSTPLRERVLGSSLTTFAIGGEVRVLVTVESAAELSAVLSLLHREGQLVRVIGNGSNILIDDRGLDCWLVTLGAGFRGVESNRRGELVVGGSASLMSLARSVSNDGLSGLEFAAGIPASLGGAVFMNAGAHHAEIGSRVVRVHGVAADGQVCSWAAGELPWVYRSSGLPIGSIVTSVELLLAEGDRQSIADTCAHNLAERRKRQPLALPSAGSFFKNPSSESPAGMLLEQLKMKGASVGGAAISELHANWIVNATRKATSRDVVELMNLCIQRAREVSGIELHPEVRLWLAS
jgi:UDP-N-acetylmuramate dehydrogenase